MFNFPRTALVITATVILAGCNITPQPTKKSEANYYNGSYNEKHSAALNLMEAARLNGAKDVKLKDGDALIDLAGNNASYGFMNSMLTGGSLLTAGLSGLAGGLLTPDSDAQYNQVIGLIDITDVTPATDIDAYGKKQLLNKLGDTLLSIIDRPDASYSSKLWWGISDLEKGLFNDNGKYAFVSTDETTKEQCFSMRVENLKDLQAYGQEVDIEEAMEWQDTRHNGSCAFALWRLKIEGVVTSEKLPWLTKGREYLVVTAGFGSNISYNLIASKPIPSEYLYLYYTTNGANIGKAKDTAYPYIQSPQGKAMYFIKPH